MFEHSFKLIKTNVLPYQKHIRRFLIFAGLFLLLAWAFGIFIGLISELAILFVIVAFIVNQISIRRVKNIGSLIFTEEHYEKRIGSLSEKFKWDKIQDVTFSKLHSSVYKLTFDEKTFLLDLTKTELMALEDFLESKDLMEDSRMPFFHR